MDNFNFVLLYVDNPKVSGSFYANLLDRKVLESSPNFAMLQLRDGVMLGLWSKTDVQPAPSAAGAASEICFAVSDPAAVASTHDAWRKRGVKIAQAPTRMDFGDTFVGLDPDGHRLRVFAPAA